MKKSLIWCLLAIVLVAGVLVYFAPMKLTKVVTEEKDMRMILNVFRIENGEPEIEVVEYQEITVEQKREVLAVLEEYSYRRTPETVVSDGTMEDMGEKMLTVHVMGENTAESVVLTSSGKISVNGRVYWMKGAGEMMEEILGIVG